jgi:uncharacterized cofD-like protein
VDGIPEAIRESMGRKVLVCNMMTQPGETDRYTVWDHAAKAAEYLGENMIEYVIANNKVIDAQALKPYNEDGAEQIIPTHDDRFKLEKNGISLIENNFVEIKKGYIRHDADRIASVVYSLLSE